MMRKVLNKAQKQKKFTFLVSLLFLISFSFSFFWNKASAAFFTPEEQIILSDDGFSKNAILVKKGTTVTWKIDGKNGHWVASDFHPSHGEYPGGGGCIGSMLDACRAMEKGESYSFTFDQTGTWGIHDHLYPGLLMTVTVKEGAAANQTNLNSLLSFGFEESKDCIEYTGGTMEQANCYTKEITKAAPGYNASPDKLAQLISDRCDGEFACYAPIFYLMTLEKGYKFAFDVTFELRKIDRQVANSCHSVAHQIGWAAYKAGPANWKETVRRIDVRCSWGAVHGVVEQHVASTKQELDKNLVKDLCNGDAPCNHGVGHLLLVQEGGNIPKALDICAVLNVWNDRHMCMTGVFMERMALQNSVEREFDPAGRRIAYSKNRLDEFKEVCDSFGGDSYTACWAEISRPALVNFDKDPKTIFDYCNQGKTQEAQRYCRRRAALDLLPTHNYDLQGMKYMCELTPAYDQEFKAHCYLGMANLAIVNMPPSQKQEIIGFCDSIPDGYQAACHDVINGASVVDSMSKNLNIKYKNR